MNDAKATSTSFPRVERLARMTASGLSADKGGPASLPGAPSVAQEAVADKIAIACGEMQNCHHIMATSAMCGLTHTSDCKVVSLW